MEGVFKNKFDHNGSIIKNCPGFHPSDKQKQAMSDIIAKHGREDIAIVYDDVRMLALISYEDGPEFVVTYDGDVSEVDEQH